MFDMLLTSLKNKSIYQNQSNKVQSITNCYKSTILSFNSKLMSLMYVGSFFYSIISNNVHISRLQKCTKNCLHTYFIFHIKCCAFLHFIECNKNINEVMKK